MLIAHTHHHHLHPLAHWWKDPLVQLFQKLKYDYLMRFMTLHLLQILKILSAIFSTQLKWNFIRVIHCLNLLPLNREITSIVNLLTLHLNLYWKTNGRLDESQIIRLLNLKMKKSWAFISCRKVFRAKISSISTTTSYTVSEEPFEFTALSNPGSIKMNKLIL